jgi:hypothetical protein
MTLLDDLIYFTGLGAADLRRIIATAPARYKQFTIPKKSGGERLIAHPSRDLKVLQRYIKENVLQACAVHDSAAAYKEGASIRGNAETHAKNRVILKLDFRDFFHSIEPKDFRNYAKKNLLSLTTEDVQICIKILFWGKGTVKPICLSIGAPTSPLISNILLADLDQKISRSAEKIGAAYTRYADDITISANRIEDVIELERRIRSAIAKTRSPKLVFNEEKRGLYTTASRRHVTGLNITPQGELSIGRERKRTISVMIHKFVTGQLDNADMGKLKGYLAFALDCEPTFVNRMEQKYGKEAISALLRLDLSRQVT